MALDNLMANTDAQFSVLVLFYVATTHDTSSFRARTLAIHKKKFNVPLSSDKYNFVKHLKTFTG